MPAYRRTVRQRPDRRRTQNGRQRRADAGPPVRLTDTDRTDALLLTSLMTPDALSTARCRTLGDQRRLLHAALTPRT
ncbi:hypothetical protein [Streptomyces marincola]|uniref:Uncharacterized protein n=1 Tax=Streptomyces marincola TaxID=2878388 RepID=A0A1W7CWR9_9ACTN|nr:hypothetical protein [Streptomyces marincola]ARQ69185.1 hypothetical protein CAG99_10200 [Streptomyces marincola]